MSINSNECRNIVEVPRSVMVPIRKFNNWARCVILRILKFGMDVIMLTFTSPKNNIYSADKREKVGGKGSG